jgi:(E)-4-hydroxy-3-methylbut-2-enyl-diphosphate synthase
MVKRNETRKIFVGDVQIGGQNKVVIQSMTNTKTKDVKATVEQILKLEEELSKVIIQLAKIIGQNQRL